MTNIPDKVLEAVAKLDINFWDQWEDIVSDFPDTEECDKYKIIIVQSAVSSIISKYLMGYEKENRSCHLEHLIKHLRLIESQTRDWNLD